MNWKKTGAHMQLLAKRGINNKKPRKKARADACGIGISQKTKCTCVLLGVFLFMLIVCK